ncbi:tRNA 2-thiouridine(34) synthase MnmA [Coprothermobacteraceae bacterium]|nr:tRNA 2-thiouridine(34) synthase MnmA [Coprothermobacteraceae bacterium]
MKVAVGISGGIDSTVALLMLREQEYDVTAVFLKLLPDGLYQPRTCCSVESRQLAERVAKFAGVPFEVWDLSPIFRKYVMDIFKAQLARGLTPNPCVYCNRYVKIGAFVDVAQSKGFELVATGHYARQLDGKLYTGVDHRKDQSYMLALVPRATLQKTTFPLGNMTRQDVLDYARAKGLVHVPRSSQDVCFVPAGGLEEFIKREIGELLRPGPMILDGHIVGYHKGFPLYTVGQRRGLGVAHKEPLYVKRIDPKHNTVELAESDGLFSDNMLVAVMNQFTAPASQAYVKIRYQAAAVPADVRVWRGSILRVDFLQPQRAVTPGQIAVAYYGEQVLWAGIILPREVRTANV